MCTCLRVCGSAARTDAFHPPWPIQGHRLCVRRTDDWWRLSLKQGPSFINNDFLGDDTWSQNEWAKTSGVMRARPSSSPRADKALRQVICHNEIKVRVGVITDSLRDYFCLNSVLFFLIYVLKRVSDKDTNVSSNVLFPMHTKMKTVAKETSLRGLSARPTTSNLH